MQAVLLVPTHPGRPGQSLESGRMVLCVCVFLGVLVSLSLLQTYLASLLLLLLQHDLWF